MADIVFANPGNPITPGRAIVHDDESFAVQWAAVNAGGQAVGSFVDRLVVTSIPEGCPGSDDVDHAVVFDSDADGDPADYTEAGLAAGKAGALMQPQVGPFAAG